MTAIIILGGHRCGTSAVAGICHELGVFMGHKLIGKNRDNPKGHYEDIEFVSLNKAIVGDWRRPLADFSPMQKQYKTLIANREKKHKVWGMKDPRLCFTLPHILPLFKSKVRVIYVTRPIKASAQSMVRRAEHPKAKGPIKVNLVQAVKLARAYRDAALIALRLYNGPVLRVAYDDLIENPKEQIGLIADFVGLPVNDKALKFVDPKLRHQKV